MLQSSQLFQLTSSRREWREHPTQQRSRVMHFNSHPHEEDDNVHWWRCCISEISTHILTKRMTLFCLRPCRTDLYFNSHPHEEDDMSLRFCIEVISISTHILTKRMTVYPINRQHSRSVISTHILTKRMTLYFKTLKVWYINFNSHPHEEDDDNILSYDTDMLFQLTSSRRGWPLLLYQSMFLQFYFNSHPHEEDDLTM